MIANDLFKRPVVLICIGLILGILSVDYKAFILVSGLLFLVFCFLCKNNNDKSFRNRCIILVFFLVFFFIGFILNFENRKKSTYDQIFDTNTSGVTCYGTIYKVEISNKGYDLYIDVNGIEISADEVNQNATSTGKDKYLCDYDIIAVLDVEKNGILTEESFNIGDYVKIKGSLYPCMSPRNPGQFDEKKYYLAKGISAKLYVSDIECVLRSDNLYDIFKTRLGKISNSLRSSLLKLYPEKEAGLLEAMLLGEKGDLDKELKALYSDIGIGHILSISGLHISLLGIGLFNIIMFCSKRLKLSVALTLIVMFSFGLMTGFAVSTKRAVIMLFCMLLARIIFKTYDGQSAGALAAIIILISNTFSLYDTGFQLSFVAVFSIFAGNEIMNRLDVKNRFVRYLAPVIFAQLGTFPVIIYNFYAINLLSIPANVIMIPMMSIVLISGLFSSIFLCFGVSVLSRIIAGPAYYILEFYEFFSGKLSQFKGSSIITGSPSVFAVLIYYLLFFLLVFCAGYIRKYKNSDIAKNSLKNNKYREGFITSKYRKLLVLFVLLLMIFFVDFTKLLSKNTTSGQFCNFLDVGQGSCVFIRNNGKNILYDGGSANIDHVGKYRIIPYLKYMGIRKLDYIFVSHTDEDHISGIKEIIAEEKIEIGMLLLSDKTLQEDTFLKFCTEKNINLDFVKEGDCFEFGNVLAPNEYLTYNDVNAASIVLLLDLKNTSVLLTGDSDIFSETIYMDEIDGYINVLQVAHHGSKNSTSNELLNKIRPQVAVISCSKRNSYGHPAPQLIERLENASCDIFKTYECGMISLICDEDEFLITKFIN